MQLYSSCFVIYFILTHFITTIKRRWLSVFKNSMAPGISSNYLSSRSSHRTSIFSSSFLHHHTIIFCGLRNCTLPQPHFTTTLHIASSFTRSCYLHHLLLYKLHRRKWNLLAPPLRTLPAFKLIPPTHFINFVKKQLPLSCITSEILSTPLNLKPSSKKRSNVQPHIPSKKNPKPSQSPNPWERNSVEL
jgi:hypothetical protein